MVFTVASVVIPVLVYYLLPKFVQLSTERASASKIFLIIGGLLFFIAQYLASPKIDGQDTQFITHIVGGGFYAGFIWLFLKENLRWNFNPSLDLLGLFFLTSGLGAANEIFELAGVKFGFLHITITDTSWDILANTAGALIFWLVYRLVKNT